METRTMSLSGLDARPPLFKAAQMVNLAMNFNCRIMLRLDDLETNARSYMGLTLLSAQRGETLAVIADGENEQEAADTMMNAIRAYLCGNAVTA